MKQNLVSTLSDSGAHPPSQSINLNVCLTHNLQIVKHSHLKFSMDISLIKQKCLNKNLITYPFPDLTSLLEAKISIFNYLLNFLWMPNEHLKINFPQPHSPSVRKFQHLFF